MKSKIVSLTAVVAVMAMNVFAQGNARSGAALPAHYPKQKTEANLKAWAKQHPEEAGTYTKNLWDKMTRQNQNTPAEQKVYDDMKQEYNVLAKVVTDAPAKVSAKSGK